MRATPSDQILLGRWWWRRIDGEVQLRLQTRSPPNSQTTNQTVGAFFTRCPHMSAGCGHLRGTRVTTGQHHLLLQTLTDSRSADLQPWGHQWKWSWSRVVQLSSSSSSLLASFTFPAPTQFLLLSCYCIWVIL